VVKIYLKAEQRRAARQRCDSSIEKIKCKSGLLGQRRSGKKRIAWARLVGVESPEGARSPQAGSRHFFRIGMRRS